MKTRAILVAAMITAGLWVTPAQATNVKKSGLTGTAISAVPSASIAPGGTVTVFSVPDPAVAKEATLFIKQICVSLETDVTVKAQNMGQLFFAPDINQRCQEFVPGIVVPGPDNIICRVDPASIGTQTCLINGILVK